jgi:tRNA threonylcarbamoyladenosine modification (KEOPS) complex Cgi121 subunit
MASLIMQEVFIGTTPHQVGIFGCTRSKSLTTDAITDITQQLTTNPDFTFLIVDADYVAGADHLLFATIHALTAFSRNSNRASTRQMEILRFAAAQRQISQALKLLGVSESTRRFAGVLTNSNATELEFTYQKFLKLVEATDDPSVILLSTSKKARTIQSVFQIPDEELEAICPSQKQKDRRMALQKLVYDRCALIAIAR